MRRSSKSLSVAPLCRSRAWALVLAIATVWCATSALGQTSVASRFPSPEAGFSVEIQINRTAALADDFVIVAPAGNTTVWGLASVSLSPPGDPEQPQLVHLVGGGTGQIVFDPADGRGEVESIAVELAGDGRPTTVRLFARTASNSIGGSALEVRTEGPGGPLVGSHPLTLIERPAIHFRGSFQDRLPVNPDGSFDDNPQCGFVRRLDSEFPFEAAIRMAEPFELRSFCTFEPVIVTEIVAEQPVGAAFAVGDAVFGQELRLHLQARFIGDPPGTEFISPFVMEVGDGLMTLTANGDAPRGRGETSGAGLPEYINFNDSFFAFIGNIAATTAYFDARVAALQGNTDAYPAPPLPCPNNPDPEKGPPIGPETRLSWLEYFDGGIKQIMQGVMTGAGLYTGPVLGTVPAPPPGSPLLALYADVAEFDVEFVFFAFDADCVVGRVAGRLRPRAPACPCGDFDADGVVALADFTSFATCFGLAVPSAACAAPAYACADLDADGTISLADFSTFAAIFGTAPGATTPPDCASPR